MAGGFVRVGCGAGFQGDRLPPAVSLLKNADLDYLVLECLAERTLADSIDRMRTGGKGYDTRLKEWLDALLPIACAKNVTIITNMGAADPEGAGLEAAAIAKDLGIAINIAVVKEVKPGIKGAAGEIGCTYLGADCIVEALSQGANLVIAGRVADPSLFVAPMAYTFGWNLQKDFSLLAQATLAGHLLECGCHLTGGYFAHPMGRDLSIEALCSLSLPFCDVSGDGTIILRKLEGSGGELSERTCKQQLTYEIGDPTCYITPDVCVDFSRVTFEELSPNCVRACGAQASSRPDTLLRLVAKLAGFKAWAEVAYGGLGCVERARMAAQQVSYWMEERKPGIMQKCLIYLLGYNSLFMSPNLLQLQDKQLGEYYPPEVRLRFDGLFDTQADAMGLVADLSGLGLCGPAGGGGYAYGIKPDISISKQLLPRAEVVYAVYLVNKSSVATLNPRNRIRHQPTEKDSTSASYRITTAPPPAPAGRCLLYNVAHSRSGDKGDTANVSVIPYNADDLPRLQKVITPDWVREVYGSLLSGNESVVKVYTLPGISSLNITLSPVLDGGVSVSRRIDRHGKTLSDLILNQWVTLPPTSNL
jgi:hypothetical protein